jgi:hypothetical protein
MKEERMLMTESFRWSAVAMTGALILMSIRSASATLLYSETFPNTVNNTPVNTVGWFSYRGATAVDRSAGTSSTQGIVLSSGAGVNGDLGLAFAASAGASAITLFGTEEPGIVSQAVLDTITFYLRSFTVGGGRAAIRIDTLGTVGNTSDDTWYATDTLFAEAGATLVQQTFTFNTAAATWRDVTFAPATTLAIAGAVRSSDLPSGNVTAFGMLFDASSTNGVRLDNYEINVVPEPSGIFLVGSGLLGLIVHSRRRRRS